MAKLQPFFRQFLIGVLDRIDQHADANGFILVFDFTGAGTENVDMDFLHFIFKSFRKAYPQGIKLIVAYNFPKILETFWNMAKAWLGKERKKIIKFVHNEEIKTLISPDNLPKYLGGNNSYDFTEVPPECQPVAILGRVHGFTPKEIDEYLAMFQPHIDEAAKLVKNVNKKFKSKLFQEEEIVYCCCVDATKHSE